MKVLVLGAGGFLGSHVVAQLAARGDHEVFAGMRPSAHAAFDPARVTVLPGDLTDPGYVARAVQDKDAIVFTAGRTWEPGLSLAEYDRLNVGITRTFFEALGPKNRARIVYTSSTSAVAGSLGPIAFTEESPRTEVCTARLSPYDWAKIESERIALEYAGAGGDVRVLNPGVLLGPGAAAEAKLASPHVILWACQNKMPFFIESSAAFSDVRDVAAAHVAALERGTGGRRYIVGGHNRARSQFYAMLARLTGVKPPRPFPAAGFSVIAAVSDALARLTFGLLKSPVHRRFAGSLPLSYCGDSQRAVDELGFSIRPLEQTLIDTLADYVRRGLLPDRFRFLESLSAENAAELVCLQQCARQHTFARFLAPRMPRVYAICRSNHSLRAALARVLQRSRFNERSGRFEWDRRACRDELAAIGQFFEYLYFASDEFLGEVL